MLNISSTPPATTTVAILGCGKRGNGKVGWAIGHAHAKGWLAAQPNLRLCGVDPSQENLLAFGQTFNLPAENLFPSTDALYASLTPDYVSVCTWPGLHAAQVIEAAGKKVKGIACEKPIAMDGQQMAEMTGACRNSGTRLVIAHQRRHLPVFEHARQIIAEGKIGDGLVLEARVEEGWDMLSWSTHWMDMACFLLDASPESVLAGVDFTGERRYQHAVENSSVVFVEFSGGKQAVFVSGPKSTDGYSVHVRGSKGHLSVTGHTLRLFTEEGFSSIDLPDAVAGGYGPLLASLVDAVEKGSVPRCDESLSRQGTAIAFAAHESARTQRAIQLPMSVRFAPLEVLAHPVKVPPLDLPGRVILMADDHHDLGGRHGLSLALREITGRELLDLEAANGLTKTDVEGAGLIALFHTQQETSLETRAVLASWVNAGRPLLIVHCAVGAYSGWPEYQEWCGRVWDWGKSQHPHEPSVLWATDDTAFPWAEAWLPETEVFTLLSDRSEVTDTCFARISTGKHPAAWVSKRWPNIATWIPGHRGDLYGLAPMRDGLRAMIKKALHSTSKR